MNKSQSYITFNVSILGDVWIQGTNVEVMFSTEDGTARGKGVGSDDVMMVG